MTHETQNRFANVIEKQIDYFRKEFDLTYYEAIGVLTYMAQKLTYEVLYDEDEDEDEDEIYA